MPPYELPLACRKILHVSLLQPVLETDACTHTIESSSNAHSCANYSILFICMFTFKYFLKMNDSDIAALRLHIIRTLPRLTSEEADKVMGWLHELGVDEIGSFQLNML
jgi:hypothetical protein